MHAEVRTGMKMTKAELVANMAEKSGLTKKKAEAVLNAVMESVAVALHNGERVTLVGFGTFAVARRAERVGRNPKTGQAMKIPAHKVPVFRPGKELKEKI